MWIGGVVKLTQDVLELIKDKPLKEVEDACRALTVEVKHLKSRKLNRLRMDFTPGKKCIITERQKGLPHGTIGVVVKVNKKTFSVDFGVNGKHKVDHHVVVPYPRPKETGEKE